MCTGPSPLIGPQRSRTPEASRRTAERMATREPAERLMSEGGPPAARIFSAVVVSVSVFRSATSTDPEAGQLAARGDPRGGPVRARTTLRSCIDTGCRIGRIAGKLEELLSSYLDIRAVNASSSFSTERDLAFVAPHLPGARPGKTARCYWCCLSRGSCGVRQRMWVPYRFVSSAGGRSMRGRKSSTSSSG